ncbi:hypothetical protein KL906_004703 [Ogataea polymorpha]|uniref:Protein BIG1 n=1 Tax=Ogataea polymorpha TaxID=460523 RepID=A0A9P8TH63_9ASCO|nr:hypothetical protein KL937_004538 [Ogataea polymorpha]KAG7891363.1 hypothetical protein KL908_004116 [Ogataea polymorpha]KAG7906250.1 hypothetical protein KL906_004703 [Ogataea polymorpha]KAG7930633.1 hypothetical protein KL934_004706 [Ogataea polymorpha]KAG7932192.1 hypothetical protein KL904_004617 [Ogataea polymorpha]
MRTSVVIVQLVWAALCLAKNTFPALIASSKLIPGLRPALPHSEQLPFDLGEATSTIYRVLEQCTSDAYILINMPGLRVDDFHHFERFRHLREQLSRASTVVAFPNVLVDDDKLAMDDFVRFLRIHCNTLTYDVVQEDAAEVPKYLDTRARTINVQLGGLSDEMSQAERLEKLDQYNELLREIMRKLPTPRYTLLLSTNTTTPYEEKEYKLIHPEDVPEDPKDLTVRDRRLAKTALNMIFPDITVFDKTRYLEIERNNHGERDDYSSHPDGLWAKDLLEEDDTWLAKKTKTIKKEKSLYRFSEDQSESPAVFDREFLIDNGPVIVGGLFVVLTLFALDILRGIVRQVAGLIRGKKLKSE